MNETITINGMTGWTDGFNGSDVRNYATQFYTQATSLTVKPQPRAKTQFKESTKRTVSLDRQSKFIGFDNDVNATAVFFVNSF